MKSNNTIGVYSVGRQGFFWHVGIKGAMLCQQVGEGIDIKRRVVIEKGEVVFCGLTPDQILFLVCVVSTNRYRILAVDFRCEAIDQYDFECEEMPFYSMRLSANGNYVYLGSNDKIARVFISRTDKTKCFCKVIPAFDSGKILGIIELSQEPNSLTYLFITGNQRWGHLIFDHRGAIETRGEDVWQPKTPRSDFVSVDDNKNYAAISVDRTVCIYSSKWPSEPVYSGYGLPTDAEVISLTSAAPGCVVLTFRAKGLVHFRKWVYNSEFGALIDPCEAEIEEKNMHVISAASSHDCKFGMYATNSTICIIQFLKT